jgi:hypothetical protein
MMSAQPTRFLLQCLACLQIHCQWQLKIVHSSGVYAAKPKSLKDMLYAG